MAIPFEKVDYLAKYPGIDCFRTLGRLPIPIPIPILLHWYTDGESKSELEKEVLGNQEKWRLEYWKTFSQGTNIKTSAWAYEKEHRLVLKSMLDELVSDEDRTLHYDFADLAGIIFGIKTPVDAKLKILKAIEKKCAENKCYDIKFYQAEYDHSEGTIEARELGLIKVTP